VSAVPGGECPSLRSHAADLPGPAALLGPLQDSGADRQGGMGFFVVLITVTLQNFFDILIQKIIINIVCFIKYLLNLVIIL
jgi:hypothetical protein